MTFLPEEDREFLANKAFSYEEVSAGPGQRAIAVHSVRLPEDKFLGRQPDGTLQPVEACDVLIMIPDRYPITTLDSFYTDPFLYVAATRSPPQNSAGDQHLFERRWQFWSRHLNGAHQWRPGIDGLHTYWDLVLFELRRA